MEGEAAAVALVQVLVRNLIDISNKEISLIPGLDKNAQKLTGTLQTVHEFLNDAETRTIPGGDVKTWLKKLEQEVFDADNVFDQLRYHHLSNQINAPKSSTKAKLRACFSSRNHHRRQRRMALRIEQIEGKLKSINDEAAELGLTSKLANAPALPHASKETGSLSAAYPIFVGRDDDVLKLADVLTDAGEERKFSTVAIWGAAGVGKTTLTMNVFDHERVKTRFGESRIWVHVSKDFDPVVILKNILQMVTSSLVGNESREAIVEMLDEVLKGRTYLLVLDDVWNEDTEIWEDFMNALSGVTSTMGNGIVVTTRSEKVASIVKPFETLPLKGLSDEECWSIIKAKAFNNGEDSSEFETIGGNIARKCRGLPFAANVVGGLLYKASKEKWDSIRQNWLSKDEGDSISELLRLSFHNLSSPSLKKCLAYCSVIPKGYEIGKDELIELWMAEGLLQPDGGRDMESVGDMNLNILLHSSLLQVAAWDDYGDVERCSMHDLVHDLACSVLGSSENTDGITPIRYMFLKDEASPIPKKVARHVRTLFWEGEISDTMLSYFKCLHVLGLSCYDTKKLPKSVRKMIHLRNLDISETIIQYLPDWMGELYHLQTLRADCSFLKALPSTLKYLINLRHLYIHSHVELPAEIGRLTCLQTLTHFRVGDTKGYRIEELGSLNNLKGKLEISNLEMVRDMEEALKASMLEKPDLYEVAFEWSGNREVEVNDESVLEGLQPHANANLKKLKITGFEGERFPSWIMKMAVRDGPQGSWVVLNKLVEISLSMCSECEEIPMLEHLPNLKSLSLVGLKKVRFINSSFENLASLRIDELEALETLPDWLFYNNPNLTKLEISQCCMLRELPDGLDTLSSLEDLHIRRCYNLKSLGNRSHGGGMMMLRSLKIEWCTDLLELPREMVESSAPLLETLCLNELDSLENLPVVMECLARSAHLRKLTIVGVPNFMAGGSVESWGLGSLRELKIDVSKESSGAAIEETMDGILQGCGNSLAELWLKGVENWEWLPRSIQHLNAFNSFIVDDRWIGSPSE